MSLIYWQDIKPYIKPLDLILFAGNECISKLIRYIADTNKNKKHNNKLAGRYSHIGIVVTKNICPPELHKYMEDNKLYIFESTIGGYLGNNIYSIDNKTKFGVQVRDLDELVKSYNGDIALLAHKDRNTMDKTTGFIDVFNKYNNVNYDYNIIALLTAGIKKLRFLRYMVDICTCRKYNNKKLLFCSELVASVFSDLHLLNTTSQIHTENTLPTDFINGVDADEEINIDHLPIIPFIYSKTYIENNVDTNNYPFSLFKAASVPLHRRSHVQSTYV
jgi:hypothetical protein